MSEDRPSTRAPGSILCSFLTSSQVFLLLGSVFPLSFCFRIFSSFPSLWLGLFLLGIVGRRIRLMTLFQIRKWRLLAYPDPMLNRSESSIVSRSSISCMLLMWMVGLILLLWIRSYFISKTFRPIFDSRFYFWGKRKNEILAVCDTCLDAIRVGRTWEDANGQLHEEPLENIW